MHLLRRGRRSVAEPIARLPERHTDDRHFGELASLIMAYREAEAAYVPRESGAPYRQWGEDLDRKSVDQMHWACQLPVAVPRL